MKYIILFLCHVLAIYSLPAQTISGKIAGFRDGEKIRLYTNPDNQSQHKWGLGRLVDSCTVVGGVFKMDVPKTANGRLWLLRTPDVMIEYFFNKNEDFTVEGIASPIGLLNSKTSGGKEYALQKDIFSILDKESVTPANRREGVEWLKRHAAEDICAFATAYFYINKRELRHMDVKEIMDCIPQAQKQNPYFLLLDDFFRKDRLVQPGLSLPGLTLWPANGKKIPAKELKDCPLVIYSSVLKNSGESCLRKLKQLTALQQTVPGLCIVLILPEFPEDVSARIAAEIAGRRVITADYSRTSAANPALFYNKSKWQSTILANRKGEIIAVDPFSEEYADLFAKDFPSDGFTINGYVSGIDDGMAQLVMSRKGTLAVPEVIDSVDIRYGYFTFRGKIENPQYCNIAIRNTIFPVGFFLENSSIDVNILARNYSSTKDGITTRTKALNGDVYSSRSQEEYKFLLNLRSPELIESWLTEHPDNIPALLCLATTWEHFSPETIEKWLNKVDKSLVNHVAYQETLKQINKRKELSAGREAPDFTLPSATGEPMSLKAFRGKYVLLDFWASWCGPCREEIPTLKKVWNRYHEKGLEIISVTIDRKDEEWLKALQDEQMPWNQLNAKGTKTAELYNVQGVPHILLIDPEGKIKAINLRGEKLEKLLEEIFI